jgi:hypothetical protein
LQRKEAGLANGVTASALKETDDFLECGGLPPLCLPHLVRDPKAGASSRTPNCSERKQDWQMV